MTLTVEVILAAMLALTQAALDRGDTVAARRDLYRPTAAAIADVARSPEEAAALVAVAYGETRLARYVLEGRCLDGPVGQQCDKGRDGKPRARGPWQVWGWCVEAWRHPDGSPESIRGGAACAARRLRDRGSDPCPAYDAWRSRIAGYGRDSCSSARVTERHATWLATRRRLWRLMQQESEKA